MSMGFILPLSARVLHSVSSYVGSFVDIGGGAEAGRRAAADLSLHDKAILRPFRLDVFPHVLLRLWFVPALEIGRSSLKAPVCPDYFGVFPILLLVSRRGAGIGTCGFVASAQRCDALPSSV
jgi:hypothetical protein